MLRFSKPGLLFAAVACAGLLTVHVASAATEERLSQPELLKLNECMAMKPDALAGDTQCSTVMKKASLTTADIEKMRRCEAKFNVEPQKDPDCAAMIKKHPDLVRGHGSLMPQDAKPAPK
jgi:hypothetical protein